MLKNMQLFQKIYSKLLTFFDSSPPKNANIINTKQPNYIGNISFSLTDKFDIDISCSVPDFETLSTEKLTTISEQYAKFLCHITDGDLIDDIIEIITKEKNKPDSEKKTLILDNILFFWALTHVEKQEKAKKLEKSGQPVIRPLDVFQNE